MVSLILVYNFPLPIFHETIAFFGAKRQTFPRSYWFSRRGVLSGQPTPYYGPPRRDTFLATPPDGPNPSRERKILNSSTYLPPLHTGPQHPWFTTSAPTSGVNLRTSLSKPHRQVFFFFGPLDVPAVAPTSVGKPNSHWFPVEKDECCIFLSFHPSPGAAFPIPMPNRFRPKPRSIGSVLWVMCSAILVKNWSISNLSPKAGPTS